MKNANSQVKKKQERWEAEIMGMPMDEFKKLSKEQKKIVFGDAVGISKSEIVCAIAPWEWCIPSNDVFMAKYPEMLKEGKITVKAIKAFLEEPSNKANRSAVKSTAANLLQVAGAIVMDYAVEEAIDLVQKAMEIADTPVRVLRESFALVKREYAKQIEWHEKQEAKIKAEAVK